MKQHKYALMAFAIFASMAFFACSDDQSINVIEIDEEVDDNGDNGEENGMTYSISFNIEGGDPFTFYVDMTDAVIEGDDLPDDFEGDILEFDPENHEVYIAGGFPGDLDWNEPGSNTSLRLSAGGRTGGTIDAGEVPYKYFIVIDQEPSWGYGEWEGDPNRVTEVTSGGSEENVWADEAPESDTDNSDDDDAELPESIYVPGGYQAASGYGDDWSPDTAPVLGQKDTGVYSGYVYFAEAAEFKFTAGPTWDDGDWGGENGTLDSDGDDLNQEDTGFIRFDVNLNDLAYASTPTTWSVIGDAANGWEEGDDVDMEFDTQDKLWTVTLDLDAEGEFKFRANNDWDINIGANGGDNELVDDGDNLTVEESGNYTIVLDLNGETYSYEINQN